MSASKFMESAYLPYQTSDLPHGRWLVLAPHADDETFGMGGAIACAVANGTKVHVLIMTDGAQGGDANDLTRLREQEAKEATARLGCERVLFLREPDRGLPVSDALICHVAEVMQAGSYDAVFFPSPVEPHPDHRATAQIGWEALRRNKFSAAPFSYEISTQGPCNTLVDISSVVEKKTSVMRLYTSQLTQNAYVERILGLNAARAWSLPLDVTHAEAFYLWAPIDQPLSAQLWGLQYAQQSDQALPSVEALVSIILRTKNRPQMLREAIRSVAHQTHTSIELVVVNDGQDDLAALIDEEATGSIKSICYVSSDGTHGRAHAGNLGLLHASGDYIGFLDDDDWLLPNHCSVLLHRLHEHPAAIACYGGVDSVRFEDGREVFLHRFNDPFDPLRLAYNNFMPIHSVLFRKAAIQRGCAFNEHLDLYEDWHFWLQMAQLGVFVHVDEVTAKYRIGTESGVGLPSSQRDVTQDMNRFVEASRSVWNTEQLRHLCMAAYRVKTLSEEAAALHGELNQLKEQREQLTAQIQTLVEREEQPNVRLNDQNEQFTHLISQLRVSEQELAFRQRQFEEIINSRSWRLTRPLRFFGRKVRAGRHLIRRAYDRLRSESWRVLLKKTHKVWQNEGLSGVWLRVKGQQHNPAFALADSSRSVRSVTEASIVRQADGHYALQEGTAGYQYIPPAPPLDLDNWLTSLKNPPKFSIVVPVYNTPPGLLTDLVNSVLAQWYPHWELVLVDDASTSESLQHELAALSDPRIRIIRLDGNQGISGATNAGVAAAKHDWVIFADHDDLLTADSLYELVRCIERESPDFIYSDEDKLDEQGRFVQPHFKPDWSPDTMMSTMFTGHISCVRKALFEQLGGLRCEVNGCQDWDFVLRLAEITQSFCHIPKVLYHWRVIPASIAADLAAKPYVLAASKKVREDALLRRGLAGQVEAVEKAAGYFRINYQPQNNQLISIIIPTRDHAQILQRCIESIERMSSYRHFEIIVLDNGSKDNATLVLLATLEKENRVRVIRHDRPFNFSELNNIGAKAAQGELLLFLNDDTEVLTDDWLERMAGYAQLPHVGAVGAKLLYPNNDIQHAGIINLADGPGHAFLHASADSPGYFMRNLLEYNWLAVTGACLMVEAKKFHAVGGFDERFPVAYNDVELCFRLVDSGLYNMVCQAVRLRHYESQTRGIDHLDADKRRRLKDDKRRLYAVHPRYFQYDPFHNTNLHPNGIYFELLV
ncbi:MAG: glycosyltransferase [Candidatus Cloacimonetes bacterium]|nr:glycosyltransferase [Candidatus Cloacimonadota bacterium]